MKKILILAYDFPPYNSMGSQRPYAWFKYFHEFGLYPIIVTRHWGETYKDASDYIKPSEIQKISIQETETGTIINVPYNPNYRDRLILKYGLRSWVLYRKFITLLYTILQYLFFPFDNRKGIYDAADNYIKEHKPDYIIATGEPFILFRYASKLSKKHSIPWIADYRDYWSKDFNLNNHIETMLYTFFYTPIEKHFVKSASLITTVGPLIQNLQKALFPKKKIEIILNGYFEDEYPKNTIENQRQETFNIVFGGTIYLFNPVEIFLEGLAICTQNGECQKIRATFYGSNFELAQKERIQKNSIGIENHIKMTDRLTRNELYSEYYKASCLLIFANQQMIPGKLLEYLPINKKILMAGKDNGFMEQIITDTNTGIICSTAQEIAEALKSMYKEWETTGSVKCQSRNIEEYSRRFQTQKLANLIKGIEN